jgi:hypothetical protein
LYSSIGLVALVASAALAEPVDFLASSLRGARQPQLAVAANGRVHVVFGKDSAIYHVSSPDGRVFSAPVQIDALDKLALGMRRGPRVAVAGGSIVVTAISHADGMLHCWRSLDGGRTWRADPLLNSASKSAREGLHAMAGDGHGVIAVAWLDSRAKGAELWSRVSRDGGATWGAETRVYASPDGHICECCHPSLALGPHGEIAALWRNWLGGARDMWLAVSRDGGATFPEPRKLGIGTWRLNGCPMDGGALAFTANGQPHTVWRREKTVFSSATPEREDPLSEAGAQPVVNAGVRGIVTVWEERGGLMIQRGVASPARLTESGRAAALAGLPNGATAIVWETDETILADIR